MSEGMRRKVDRDILEYIGRYSQRVGCGPSYREIGRAVGLNSTSSVSRHVLSLKQEGLLGTDRHGRLCIVREVGRPQAVGQCIPAGSEQRLMLSLADGGELRLDCYIDQDSETGTAAVRLGGVFEPERISGKVTRIVNCRIEQERERRVGGKRG